MDEKVTAILLKATDLRENDKQVRLFCTERGLITATMRGVKKSTAKLKFASQPFAFCEYELNEKKGNYTITGATVIEETFSLCSDVNRFAVASVVAEIVEKSATAIDSGLLFIVTLKTIKAILYSTTPLLLIATKFIQKVLSMTGFITLPTKKESYPDTAKGLLDEIAFLTLDELEVYASTASEQKIKNAFTIAVRDAEKVFETQLKSVKFLLEIN